MSEELTKCCSKCKVVKGVGEFGKDKPKKDGLRSDCKKCHALYKQKYRQENPEKEAESCSKCFLSNTEKILGARRKRRQLNLEKERKADLERTRKYRQAAAEYALHFKRLEQEEAQQEQQP